MSEPVQPSAAPALDVENERLRALCEWQGHELSKRMKCVNCGEEPHPDSELYSTVCPSCRMCFSCCEPMCPTCGDLDGTKLRAIDLRNENTKLLAEVARLRALQETEQGKRLRELAVQAAKSEHYQFYRKHREPNEVVDGHTEHVDDCPHPDCVLVRTLQPPGESQT